MKKEPIKTDDIIIFKRLQVSLLDVFFRKYNFPKDFDFLLDFPRVGELLLDDGSHWSFLKHGRGIRFNRVKPKPNVCVDAHTHLENNKLITTWRLSRYFLSLGNNVSNENIEALVKDMESQGMINKTSRGYILNSM
ncbi:TPA: DUF6896 domain-containing protein [Serratia fonticola]